MAGLMRYAAWILAIAAIASIALGVPMLFWKDMVPLSEFNWAWLVYFDLGGNLLIFPMPLLGFLLVAEARVLGGGPFLWRWWGGAVLIVLFLLEVGSKQETYAGRLVWVPEMLFWGRIAAVWPIWYFATKRAEQRRSSAG